MKAASKIYGPAAIALLLIFLSISPSRWIPRKPDGAYFAIPVKDAVPHGWAFLPDLEVSSDWDMRLVMWLGSLIALAYYGALDYAGIISPEHSMLVYFDDSGIERMLKEFGSLERYSLSVAENFRPLKQSYLEKLGSELAQTLKFPPEYRLNGEYISTNGRTTFKTRKLAGFGRYKLEEADGHLDHHLTDIDLTFGTQFSKVSSPRDVFQVDLKEVFLCNRVITAARFRQHVYANKSERLTQIPDHVIGVTRIRMLPLPGLDSSIYFTINELEGADPVAVPIAYCVYTKA